MNRDFGYSAILLFFSPILGLFSSIRSNNYRTVKWGIVLFVTLYGSIITLSENNDGYVHRDRVYEHYVDLGFGDFVEETVAILKFRPQADTNDDLYIHVLSYFIGGMLGVPQLFFVIVSFIYGYFFAGSMMRVFRIRGKPANKLSYLFYGFAILFVLYKSIEGINTVRTWTGLWILFYAAISYFETRNRKYLFLLFVPPFIHVGYFAMALPAWGVAMVGARPVLYALIFFGSLVTPRIEIAQFLGGLGNTELAQNKFNAYYVEDVETFYRQFEQRNSTWYVRLKDRGLQKLANHIFIFALILAGIYRRRMNFIERHLFSIGILTLAFSNFAVSLFALHERSSLIGTVFCLATLVLLLKRGFFDGRFPFKGMVRFTLYGVLLLSVPYFIYKAADLIQYTSLFVLALPFAPWFFEDLNLSIREFLGWFL